MMNQAKNPHRPEMISWPLITMPNWSPAVQCFFPRPVFQALSHFEECGVRLCRRRRLFSIARDLVEILATPAPWLWLRSLPISRAGPDVTCR